MNNKNTTIDLSHVINCFPGLIPLIEESTSLDKEEKQYWLDLLNFMNDEQIERLENILQNEKNNLEKLEKEYQETLLKIN